MKNKNWLLAMALCVFAGHASAQSKTFVWRYTEGGHVSYSNVPIKGKKGEKVEMMSYPAPAPRPIQYDAPVSSGSAASQVGAPVAIPAEVLRQIKTGAGGKPPLPPMGLPPLPSMPGAVALPRAAVAAAPSAMSAPSSAPARAQAEPERPTVPSGPSWARQSGSTQASAGPAPSWAKDPFSQ